MQIVMPEVLRAAGLDLQYDVIMQGSPLYITFKVTVRDKSSSAQAITFSGYPDFAVIRSCRRRSSRVHLVRGVGEHQSRKKPTPESSIAQTGISALGVCAYTSQTRIVNIILTKKKEGLVLTLKKDDKWKMKFVYTMDPVPLREPTGLHTFTQMIVGAFIWQAENDA